MILFLFNQAKKKQTNKKTPRIHCHQDSPLNLKQNYTPLDRYTELNLLYHY